MEKAYQNVINVAKATNLKVFRQGVTYPYNSGNYTYKDIGIAVETIYNNGSVSHHKGLSVSYLGMVFMNKCCFISIYHGLERLQFLRNYPDINPYALMNWSGFLESCSNYKDRNALIDTDNPIHEQILVNLASIFKIKIHFFIGIRDQFGKWSCVPDHYREFGQINSESPIIRILNKPNHFEYITTNPTDFIIEYDDNDEKNAIQDQFYHENELLCKLNTYTLDEYYTKKLNLDDIKKEEMMLDEYYAKKIHNDERNEEESIMLFDEYYAKKLHNDEDEIYAKKILQDELNKSKGHNDEDEIYAKKILQDELNKSKI
jgi:hypothetical protein